MATRDRGAIVTTDSAIEAIVMILGAAILTAAVIFGIWFFAT